MAVITGVLNELGPGVEDMKRRMVYRDFIDIGNSHLRKIGHDTYFGNFLEKSVGMNTTISTWRGLIVAIKLPDGKVLKEEMSKSLWTFVLWIFYGVFFAIAGVSITFVAFFGIGPLGIGLGSASMRFVGSAGFSLGVLLSLSLILILPLWYGGTRIRARSAL